MDMYSLFWLEWLSEEHMHQNLRELDNIHVLVRKGERAAERYCVVLLVSPFASPDQVAQSLGNLRISY